MYLDMMPAAGVMRAAEFSPWGPFQALIFRLTFPPLYEDATAVSGKVLRREAFFERTQVLSSQSNLAASFFFFFGGAASSFTSAPGSSRGTELPPTHATRTTRCMAASVPQTLTLLVQGHLYNTNQRPSRHKSKRSRSCREHGPASGLGLLLHTLHHAPALRRSCALSRGAPCSSTAGVTSSRDLPAGRRVPQPNLTLPGGCGGRVEAWSLGMSGWADGPAHSSARASLRCVQVAISQV
jgi:hypothetical protein